MSYMLIIEVIVLAAFVVILICWFSRLRPEMVRKGYKYSAIAIPFSWIIVGLFNGTRLLLRELTILQQGSVFDEMWSYAYAILIWAALAALSVGIIVDLVKCSRSSQHV